MLTLAMLLALQSAESEFNRLEEWAKAQADNGPGAIGVGDEYWKVAKKFPKDRIRFVDKANEWWGKGWPLLDNFWKDKTRDNLKRLYASPAGAAARPVPKGEWIVTGGTISGERVRSGISAVKMVMPKGNEGNYHQPLKASIKLPAGAKELHVSAWVLTDETDNVNDDFKPTVVGAAGKLIYATGIPFTMDLPVWTKFEKMLSCDGGIQLDLVFEFQSRKGIVFVDDVSVKCDGKELLLNGGFEK